MREYEKRRTACLPPTETEQVGGTHKNHIKGITMLFRGEHCSARNVVLYQENMHARLKISLTFLDKVPSTCKEEGPLH